MEYKSEPKVLVISSSPFSDLDNNGKTLKSIFSSFSQENLFCFYFRPQDNVIADSSIAKSYYAVSEMDIIRNILKLRKECGGIQTFEKEKSIAISTDKTYRRFYNSKIKNWRWLRRLLWKTRRWDTKDFRNWYKDCSPDVVFALLGRPGVAYTISQEISKDLNVPLVIFFADDYIIHSIRNNFLDRWQYKRDLKKYREIIDFSSFRFCIGEQMCQEYSSFWGKEFKPIMNSVDIIPYSPKENYNSPIVISYFGGLSLGRWEMISKLSDVVKEEAEIRIYTPHTITEEIGNAFAKPNIRYCGKVVGEDLNLARQESDILLHVENDKERLRKITALSVSTKIPESMMQSRLLLGYGPSEVASMQLIQKYDVGIFISSELPVERQRSIFFSAIADVKRNKERVEKAYDFARKNFDRNVVSQQLKDYLSKLI